MATALGAAAAHARILADQEEREMEHLAATVIDQQVWSNIKRNLFVSSTMFVSSLLTVFCCFS